MQLRSLDGYRGTTAYQRHSYGPAHRLVGGNHAAILLLALTSPTVYRDCVVAVERFIMDVRYVADMV